MLRHYANDYVQIGRLYQQFLSSPEIFEFPTLEQIEQFKNMLRNIRSMCVHMRLPVSVRIIDGIVTDFEQATPHFADAKKRFEQWYPSFEAEVEVQLYMLILPHRVAYWSDDQFIGDEISAFIRSLSGNFPSTVFDAKEAGNCFASERFTACVHHLSRVVEFGLVSLAEFAGLDKKEQRNWNTVLNRTHEKLRDREGNFASIRRIDEIYFSESIGLLRNFKTAWRNPSSHAPEIFLEDKAKALFTIAKTTMEQLSERLSEVSMPNE